MSTLYGGSLCLTEIIAKAKAGHSAFSKANNGKIYFNVSIWHNDEVDKFGNEIGISLNSKADKREAEGKVYIGNAKRSQGAAAPAAVKPDADELNFTDLPF